MFWAGARETTMQDPIRNETAIAAPELTDDPNRLTDVERRWVESAVRLARIIRAAAGTTPGAMLLLSCGFVALAVI